MFTLKATNAAIGRGEFDFYEKTKDDFREFITQIISVIKAGKPINEHFAPMVTVCNVRAVPYHCLLYTSPSPRDRQKSRMPSSA